MGDNETDGEAALVRAVRSLDQGNIETVPDKLERLWNMLPGRRSDGFHAAEEMLVRWLLKSMTGDKEQHTRMRRYPLAWNLFAAVFTCVPLFSLAKSLADRRFVAILQQTLAEISEPEEQAAQTNGVDSDVEMADAPAGDSSPNPRKRKRTAPGSFDIAAQKQLEGCLQTAEAVFEAIRTLLCRCELKSMEGSSNHRMGAEHIKSLFSSPAEEVVATTLTPLLRICNLAANQANHHRFQEQSTWISTFTVLWDLRLQGSKDVAVLVAHLAVPGMNLLGQLNGVSQPTVFCNDAAVNDQWTRDLGRFLTRNLILPCRAAFLNTKDQTTIGRLADFAAPSAGQTYPILFDLVTRSPHAHGDKASKKDFDTWTQAVFDIIVGALKSNRRELAQEAMEKIMKMAAERCLVLSAESLRTVCSGYALSPDSENWNLLLPTVKLNPDVFLLSEDGKVLLQQTLRKTKEPQLFSSEDLEKASNFIVGLADGYATARDLATFIKMWTKYLVEAGPNAAQGVLWTHPQLYQMVANHVEQFVNFDQFFEILQTIGEGQIQVGSAAKIHILSALCSGIKSEELVDAANMKTFEAAYGDESSRKGLSEQLSVLRWTIAEYALPRATLDEARRIWRKIKQDAEHILRKSSIRKRETLMALKCCVGVWVANYPGGPDENEVGDIVCSFVDRLLDSMEKPDKKKSSKDGLTVKDYASWLLSECYRGMQLIGTRNRLAPTLLLLALPEDHTEMVSGLFKKYRQILDNENDVNDSKFMDKVLESYIGLLDSSTPAISSPSPRKAVRFLLNTPKELLDRSRRESIMKSLMSHLPSSVSEMQSIEPDCWRQVVSLMVKLMGMSTFYPNMSFEHVEEIGSLTMGLQGFAKDTSAESVTMARLDMKLAAQLATLSVGQMSCRTPEERDKRYLTDAIELLQKPCQAEDAVLRLTLLRSFLSMMEGSPAAKQLEGWDTAANQLKDFIVSQAKPVLKRNEWHGQGLLASLAALEALDLLDGKLIKKAAGKDASSLVEASSQLKDGFESFGWEVRMFLAKHYPDVVGFPFKNLFAKPESVNGGCTTVSVEKSVLFRYVDAVVDDADDQTKLNYLEKLLGEDDLTESNAVGELMLILRLIQHIKATKDASSTTKFDLSQAHSILCHRLERASEVPELVLAARTVNLLLDQKSSCMTQWNIEVTLSSISTIASKTSSGVTTSPKTYKWLCHLVETVIKRHRIRLDGHFHILITVLQSLLKNLLSRQSEDSPSQAKLFARLLTLVCEPTDASVSRSQASSGLDSERDRAKRYAGQYMYLVLMQYVKLQLEFVVPHSVREVLEPAMYSVLDITSPDGMKLMNDAMDPSGRVIFKELYKQYQKFGKWTGV